MKEKINKKNNQIIIDLGHILNPDESNEVRIALNNGHFKYNSITAELTIQLEEKEDK